MQEKTTVIWRKKPWGF